MERKSIVDRLDSIEFKTIVESSTSINEILIKVGCVNLSGSMHKKVKDRINREKLPTQQLLRVGKSKNGIIKIPLAEILVKNSSYLNRQRLKIRLVSENMLEYKCMGNKCSVINVWNEKPLVLQLDHINGDNTDNRIENLRFLCPNCHSQTETFGGKNLGQTAGH